MSQTWNGTKKETPERRTYTVDDMGEILGLTWENVHISDEDIAADNAYVYIDKELTRASKRAIETLGEKEYLLHLHSAHAEHQHKNYPEKAEN